jgi:TonB family protein
MKNILIILSCVFFLGATVQAAPSSDMTSWKKAVVKAISTKQKYPRSAQVREIEGRAKVRLIVSADGTITAHEIVEGTGQPVLDREIPKLVARLNPLPALPAGENGLNFIIPLEWALN